MEERLDSYQQLVVSQRYYWKVASCLLSSGISDHVPLVTVPSVDAYGMIPQVPRKFYKTSEKLKTFKQLQPDKATPEQTIVYPARYVTSGAMKLKKTSKKIGKYKKHEWNSEQKRN
ncbi:unnamed protein product [Dovyalis caffra]|uniref:Uncharacterized protein n=1 Tax=Dovyalis caffra TaxID=77055 RepID=A0AAV1QQG0_9ROSI|nr:unnamed protein product [Dovyalis caffra]